DDDASRCVASAAPGELGKELEGPLLRPKVGQAESGVRVYDSCKLDAGEVVALRDHLRADENGAIGTREPLERLPKLLRLRDCVRVEPDPLQLRNVTLELPLQALRPGSDPRELGRTAPGARDTGGLAGAAVVTAKRGVPVEGEGDVAVRAAAGDSTGTGGGGGGGAAPGGRQGPLSAPPA